jgi:hypothetical protein
MDEVLQGREKRNGIAAELAPAPENRARWRFRQRYVAGARSWDRRISLRRVVSLNA